jgi:hypothetical protein
MLGGTANHAWAEDSLYISRDPKKRGTIRAEFESKSAPEKVYMIGGLDNKGWTPFFEPQKAEEPSTPTTPGRKAKVPRQAKAEPATNPILDVLAQGGGWLVNDLADATSRGYHPTYKSLRLLEDKGLVARDGRLWRLP